MNEKLEQHAGQPHLEIERGFPLKASEYADLLLLLAKLNFKPTTTSVITDTLLPTTRRNTTNRIRREQILTDHKKRVRRVIFLLTHKAHPKLNGKHVRRERESQISAQDAEYRISRAIDKLWDSLPLDAVGHTLPSYSKIRRSYTGKLTIGKVRYEATIALDIAQGLGKYSGHYVEIEILLPENTVGKIVAQVEKGILKFAHEMLGDKRRPKYSYRKLTLKSLGLKEF